MRTSYVYQALLFHLADTDGLLRVNISTLPDQTLMELFVAEVEFRSQFQDDEGDFRPISTWNGLSFQEESVTAIFWFQRLCTGTMDMQFLPLTLTTLSIERCSASGSLNLSNLPPQMRKFKVTQNNFSGSVNLCQLPETLEELWLNFNSLRGSLDLTQLPRSLVTANFDVNRFSGGICLTNLPKALQELYADNNAITGTIRLDGLPTRIQQITLEANKISGTVDVGALPASLRMLALSENEISCVNGIQHLRENVSLYLQDNLIVQETVRANFGVKIVSLRGNTIGRIVDANGREVPCDKIKISKETTRKVESD